DLPGGEIAEDLGGAGPQLLLQPLELGLDVDLGTGAGPAQFLDLGVQFGDGLFEIEEVRIHGVLGGRPRIGAKARAGDSIGLAPAGPWSAALGPGPVQGQADPADPGQGPQLADQLGIGAHALAAVDVEGATGLRGQQVQVQRGGAWAVVGQGLLQALPGALGAQVDGQGQAAGVLAAELAEIPALPGPQHEAAGVLVLAQVALDQQDAVAGQQVAELGAGIAEEGHLELAATVLDADEGHAVAAPAHAGDQAGQHHGGLAAAVLLRAPERVQLVQGDADQGLQLGPPGVDRVAAEVVAQGLALAQQLGFQRPVRHFG